MMRAMRLSLALLAIAFALAAPVAAKEKFSPGDTIEGRAVALDGDTLRLFSEGGKPVDVRLWGIDAPEMSAEDGSGWAARAAMDRLLRDQLVVRCQVVDTDRHGRPVATCGPYIVDDHGAPFNLDEFGAAIIGLGWAVEYRKFTRTPSADPLAAEKYRQAEMRARERRAGRWKLIYGE